MAIILNDSIEARKPSPADSKMLVDDIVARDALSINYRWPHMITCVQSGTVSEVGWWELDVDEGGDLSDNTKWKRLLTTPDGATDVYYDQVYVNPDTGDDGTGVINDDTQPFATINAALQAVSAPVVYCYLAENGEFTEANMILDGLPSSVIELYIRGNVDTITCNASKFVDVSNTKLEHFELSYLGGDGNLAVPNGIAFDLVGGDGTYLRSCVVQIGELEADSIGFVLGDIRCDFNIYTKGITLGMNSNYVFSIRNKGNNQIFVDGQIEAGAGSSQFASPIDIKDSAKGYTRIYVADSITDNNLQDARASVVQFTGSGFVPNSCVELIANISTNRYHQFGLFNFDAGEVERFIYHGNISAASGSGPVIRANYNNIREINKHIFSGSSWDINGPLITKGGFGTFNAEFDVKLYHNSNDALITGVDGALNVTLKGSYRLAGGGVFTPSSNLGGNLDLTLKDCLFTTSTSQSNRLFEATHDPGSSMANIYVVGTFRASWSEAFNIDTTNFTLQSYPDITDSVIPTEATAYISGGGGDDSTAKLDDNGFPFLSLQAAIEAIEKSGAQNGYIEVQDGDLSGGTYFSASVIGTIGEVADSQLRNMVVRLASTVNQNEDNLSVLRCTKHMDRITVRGDAVNCKLVDISGGADVGSVSIYTGDVTNVGFVKAASGTSVGHVNIIGGTLTYDGNGNFETDEFVNASFNDIIDTCTIRLENIDVKRVMTPFNLATSVLYDVAVSGEISIYSDYSAQFIFDGLLKGKAWVNKIVAKDDGSPQNVDVNIVTNITDIISIREVDAGSNYYGVQLREGYHNIGSITASRGVAALEIINESGLGLETENVFQLQSQVYGQGIPAVMFVTAPNSGASAWGDSIMNKSSYLSGVVETDTGSAIVIEAKENSNDPGAYYYPVEVIFKNLTVKSEEGENLVGLGSDLVANIPSPDIIVKAYGYLKANHVERRIPDDVTIEDQNRYNYLSQVSFYEFSIPADASNNSVDISAVTDIKAHVEIQIAGTNTGDTEIMFPSDPKEGQEVIITWSGSTSNVLQDFGSVNNQQDVETDFDGATNGSVYHVVFDANANSWKLLNCLVRT